MPSVYADSPDKDPLSETHSIAVLVDNEVGALARIAGLFSGRGYNIESLSVAEIDGRRHLSRITIVTTGTPRVIDQIKAHLGRLVIVHKVVDMTVDCTSVEREMALVKIVGEGERRVEAMRMAQIFRARAVDTTPNSFIFEITGTGDKINAFIALMEPLGMVDVARTGVTGLARGPDAF